MAKLSEHAAFNLVLSEMIRQREIWGEENRHHHPLVWSAILSEENGEVAQAAMNIHFGMNDDDRNYKEELVQVAAVAISAIVDLDSEKDDEKVE